mgnify:FL=1|jgi:hypothetical protein
MSELELSEGEKLDKIKAHVKKHKGKYLLGAAVTAVMGSNYYIGKKIDEATRNALKKGIVPKNTNDLLDKFKKKTEFKPST